MLDLQWDTKRQEDMQEIFNKLGKDALYMSHYDLAKESKFSPSEWKTFITHPDVSDYIRQELTLLSQIELQKLTRDITTNARSTGTAQTLQAMLKVVDMGRSTKEGPVFIYSYTPPNINEQQADNVIIKDSDPFLK